MSFLFKMFYFDLHWASADENRNPKPNLISSGSLNPKTIGWKSNPNPLDLKSVELRPKNRPIAIPTHMDLL
jgi:hypothetical protein